jgi:hypothetical protein
MTEASNRGSNAEAANRVGCPLKGHPLLPVVSH